jgi:23S rRNA (guanosine2251-2'-O)-methyltransferase
LANFEIRQCTSQDCLLRMPIEPDIHQGKYCPRCGAPMDKVDVAYPQASGLKAVQPPNQPMAALLDNIRSVFNVGAIFRTADGAGFSQLYLCGITPTPAENATLAKTALGAEKHIPWEQHHNALLLAEALKQSGHTLWALENLRDARPIFQFQQEPNPNLKSVLIIGSERSGIDPELLSLCDQKFTLPMLGEKDSLNVAIAFGIAAYWLSFNTQKA